MQFNATFVRAPPIIALQDKPLDVPLARSPRLLELPTESQDHMCRRLVALHLEVDASLNLSMDSQEQFASAPQIFVMLGHLMAKLSASPWLWPLFFSPSTERRIRFSRIFVKCLSLNPLKK